MFSTNHLIIIAVSILLITIGTLISKKYKLSSNVATKIFFVICIISETVKNLVNIIPSKYGGYVLDPEDIPLHLCSIVIFGMLYLMLSKNEKNKEHIKTAIVVLGIVSPIFAILIPGEGVAFNKVITYQYFLYHAALFWYSLYHLITKNVTLGKKEYILDLKYLGITLMIMLYLNSALSVYGVNYCFLRKPPVEGLPILNLNHGWICYFFVLVIIGIVSVTIVHMPSMIKERKNR